MPCARLRWEGAVRKVEMCSNSRNQCDILEELRRVNNSARRWNRQTKGIQMRRTLSATLVLAFLSALEISNSAPLRAQDRREAALSVMENARALCSFTDGGREVEVRCTGSIPSENRLAFARAIADADAILTGRPRHIVFRLASGGLFAEASPEKGVHLAGSTAGTPAPKKKSGAQTVAVGTLADTVLARRGRATSIKQVGRDDYGLLVEWHYPDATYLMGRREKDGVEAYRVIKVLPHP
jgi:hypothetical protein